MEKRILAVIIVVVLVIAGVGGFFAYNYTHPASTDLPTMHLTALSPLNALATYQTGVIVSDMKALGLPVSLSLETPTESGTWLTPNSTPQFVDLGWLPDWPDPIAQQLYPMTDYSNGGTFGANEAWTTNATLNSSAALSAAFTSNTTTQMKEFVSLYHTFYNQYNYIWLPDPSTYFFVQPYINNFTYNSYENYFYNMMSYNSSYTTTVSGAPHGPTSTSTLTDVADGDSLAAPDFLDPSHGFYVQDGPLYSAVYQQLYELNGSHITQTVPVIAAAAPDTAAHGVDYATGATNVAGVPNQNYNITIRSGVHFNNSDPVNATTVWFSLYRTVVMAQGVSVDNYGGMLFNTTAYSATAPYSLPVGWLHAMKSVGQNSSSGISFPDPTNVTNTNVTNTAYAAKYLANMLSHYDPWSNATQAALISYAGQAVVVPGYNVSHSNDMNVTINLLNPYPFFLSDISEWWGNIADPLFFNVATNPGHDGVIAGSSNNYTNVNGMPGTGPYEITSVGTGLDTVTLTAVSNYWGNTSTYWNSASHKPVGNFPVISQPANIKNIVIDYTVDHSGRVSGFLDNSYQISVVSSSYISSIASVAPYKNLPLNSFFKDEGASPAVFYVSMNNYQFPTNILDFREAMWYAINQTAIDSPFYYNGTYLAQNYIGPASPNFKSLYDNATSGLANESYNFAKAVSYLNQAGIQGHFYVTLPNGTIIGDKSLFSRTIFFNLPDVVTLNAIAQNLVTAAVRFL